MRLTSSRAYTRAGPVPRMPAALVQLMEGLTKDVLKNNPTDVHEFCANHFKKLLELRDGSLSKIPLTLGEKIAKAQEKVRQRAKERQQHFDEELKHDSVNRGTHGNDITELIPNLRAPVHQDQELSLSSEVEISHEPTYNSLTSKDSNFDESDEIPISKSSTFSSVSKSTVIDLTTGIDYEANNKEDDGIDNTEMPEVEIKKESQEKDGVDSQKDEIHERENVETSKREINDDEPLEIIEIVNDQDAKIAIENVIEQSSDDNTVIQENIVSLVSDNSNDQIVKNKSTEISGKIPDENPAEELFKPDEAQPNINIVVRSNIEHIKSINKDNTEITEHEKMAKNQIEPNQDKDVPELASKVNNYDEGSNIADIITTDCPYDIVSIDNVDGEKTVFNQVNDIAIDTKNNASAAETAHSNTNDNINHLVTSVDADSHAKDSDSNESSVQVEAENRDVNEPEVKVFDEKENLTLGYIEKNNEPEGEKPLTAANEIQLLGSNTYEGNEDSKILENKDIGLPETKENVNKGDNTPSNSTSLQILSSSDNNDDSVIGSDLSKADDDILQSDSENGQNNMDLETAAVTIQKVFRSFLFKSRNSTFEDITNDEALEEDNDKNKEMYYATANIKERRPLGITRMDTVLQTVNEEKSLSLSTDDSSTLSSAATTIQAHVRGFLVRNKLNSYKTVSTNSLVNSNEMLDTDAEQQKNKTVLNIHIVPEEGNYLSRDESLITSVELSLDGSPPSSVNLHPLSYDLVSERRKLLKREDAIQSVSPPSNNSGKLSEDSVKEVLNENFVSKTEDNTNEKEVQLNPENNSPETLVTDVTAVTISESFEQKDTEINAERRTKSMSSDESDVVTPFVSSPRSLVGDYENTTKLIHSGEFHDVVLPTKVSRSDTTVVREFKNVLVYILLWNNS